MDKKENWIRKKVNTNNMKVSLITGGAGFIGSHVARHCQAMGHKVVVLDDLSGGFKDHLPQGVVFVQGSITDNQLVANLFSEYKFTYVYHLAAYAAEGLSHFIRRFNYTNNLIGSVNLINESVKHDVRCFVFTSSIAVYGANQLPMTEELVPQPEDPYGIAKYAIELDLKAANHLFGLNYVIFRPHNVYGENQNIGDKYRNVIGIFMNQLMQGKALTIFGDGMQTRAFSYIDDVAPYIATSVNIKEAYNDIFNVGADTPYTVKDLATIVSAEFGIDAELKLLEARKEVVHAHSDHKKIKEVFGDKPSVPLQEGVRRMALWAKSVGARKGMEFENVEIERNLPQGWNK